MLRPLAVSLILVAAPAAAQRGITVVSSGSEQALKLGKAVVSRPFGAQLVDRIAVVGSYAGRGRSYHLIRGEAAGECPARYVVVYRDGGGAPVVTEPFGTCSAGARARLTGGTLEVTMPAAAAGGAPTRFRFDQGRMRGVQPPTNLAAQVAPAGQLPRPAPGCSAVGTGRTERAAAIAAFEQSYPDEYRSTGTLKDAAIAPEELRAIVTDLACLSTWPGAEQVVPRAATPLFASKRHGKAAFAALDSVALDPASDANMRASVRAFAIEMIYRVDRREPL